MSNICAKQSRIFTDLTLSVLLILGPGRVVFAAETATAPLKSMDIDASDKKTSVKAADTVAATWSDIPLEKRCEGLLTFMRSTTATDLAGWTLTKPQCVVAGDATGAVSWSLEAAWQKGTKALPLRYQIDETNTQKPKVTWCIVKGKSVGCAAPWDTAFSQGKLYPTPEVAKAAFSGVMQISQGFVSLATKLDEWTGKKGLGINIFDLSYANYVKAWAQSTRSLPVTGGVAVADYTLDGEGSLTGNVKFQGETPMSLRECLGCPQTECAKSPVTFSFSGLGLTISRQLTAEEQKNTRAKSMSVSWIMMEPTPFSGGESKWPFLCGEHRFNVQKL